MTATQPNFTLAISLHLEPHQVERIRHVSPRLDVIYEPDLIVAPRFAAMHRDEPLRKPAEEARWREILSRADILFGFDYSNRGSFAELAPRVRWIQAGYAGIGQFVRQMGYDKSLPHTTITTASGIHTESLAEFCMLAILAHARQLRRMIRNQDERRWEHYTMNELAGRTLGIIGVGKIGRSVGRMGKAFGMHVIGTKRTIGSDIAGLNLDELYPLRRLSDLLQRSEYLVIVTPHTDETERLIGAQELALLPKGAFLINIGRGAVLDEQALIAALEAGHLGGAALDVFDHEPLPPDNPLWGMQNVLISPHIAATTDRETDRLIDLFCENLHRFLANEPLFNILNMETLY